MSLIFKSVLTAILIFESGGHLGERDSRACVAIL